MEKRTDATRASRQQLQRRLAPKSNPKPPPKKKSRGGNIVRALVGFLILVFVMLVGIGCGFLTASMITN